MMGGMRKVGLVLFAAGLTTLVACGGGGVEEAASAGGAEGAAATAGDSVVYVDVRSPSEFASGHVAGAINIPHTEMERRWEELEEYRDQPMVVYCRTGRRSGMALDVLRRHGFDEATNGGGLDDVARRGAPVTR